MRMTTQRSGATIVLMLFFMAILFLFVAFAIEIGRVQLVQLQMQQASDFASRAGAEAMARGVGDSSDLANFDTAIRDEVEMVIQMNQISGGDINFDAPNQIDFGVAQKNGQMYEFNETNGGSLDFNSNALRVKPDLSQFALFFGPFLGRNHMALRTQAAAKIVDRDIVVVLDRSTSMLNRDAGNMSSSQYNNNLRQLEEALYVEDDAQYPKTEFEAADGSLGLTRTQALKLAVLKFREVIDETLADEYLGLVTYSSLANSPSEAATAPGSVDIIGGLTQSMFDLMVDDGITKSVETQHPSEKYASALEGNSSNYDNFDFNYLKMRWCPGTNIADGIDRATQVLFGPGKRIFARPIMIVMTDGNHNQSGTPNGSATAAMTAHPELIIYTITFGSGADQAAMAQVAATGNGMHFHTTDVASLVDTFEFLARNAGVELIE